MSVKQFNARYSPQDDRILFRLNTNDNSEYILWLTRRVTHFILSFTNQMIEAEFHQKIPTVENVISNVQQPDKQAANFNKAYEPGAQYPLGADALLVMDAKCAMLKIEDHDVFSLDFILPGGANLNIKLPVPVMKALSLLLEEINVQAKWGNTFTKLH